MCQAPQPFLPIVLSPSWPLWRMIKCLCSEPGGKQRFPEKCLSKKYKIHEHDSKQATEARQIPRKRDAPDRYSLRFAGEACLYVWVFALSFHDQVQPCQLHKRLQRPYYDGIKPTNTPDTALFNIFLHFLNMSEDLTSADSVRFAAEVIDSQTSYHPLFTECDRRGTYYHWQMGQRLCACTSKHLVSSHSSSASIQVLSISGATREQSKCWPPNPPPTSQPIHQPPSYSTSCPHILTIWLYHFVWELPCGSKKGNQCPFFRQNHLVLAPRPVLAEFLEVPIPEGDFPRTNSIAGMRLARRVLDVPPGSKETPGRTCGSEPAREGGRERGRECVGGCVGGWVGGWVGCVCVTQLL